MKNSGIIVAFHAGRGGRFHNAGHVTYLGEKNFQDLMNLNSDTLSIGNRDERGKFCKPYLTDGNGNRVTDDDINALTGTLNFDYQYDTDWCDYIENISDESLAIIANDTNHFKSHGLIDWLENNTEYRFDERGFLITE